MKINPISLNFFQYKPQNTVTSPLRMNNGLQCDTVSFGADISNDHSSSWFNEFYGIDKLGKLKPKHKGTIYKKVKDKDGNINKVPVKVSIVKEEPDEFHFYDGHKNIGHVELSYITKEHCKEDKGYIFKNYKDEGIRGDRVIVNYVVNEEQGKYCGIGHLADLIEVAVCKELGIKPNVVSESLDEPAPLHYLRGKRFVPYEKYVNKKELQSLEGENPNKIIKQIIDETPKGEKFKVPKLHNDLVMYMPRDMIKKLEKELEENPIF